MKTVKDACELQPNALSIKLSDQVEQLDELINTEGDGRTFFEKTHITQGMQDLIEHGYMLAETYVDELLNINNNNGDIDINC